MFPDRKKILISPLTDALFSSDLPFAIGLMDPESNDHSTGGAKIRRQWLRVEEIKLSFVLQADGTYIGSLSNPNPTNDFALSAMGADFVIHRWNLPEMPPTTLPS
jgi:hypothetical protein